MSLETGILWKCDVCEKTEYKKGIYSGFPDGMKRFDGPNFETMHACKDCISLAEVCVNPLTEKTFCQQIKGKPNKVVFLFKEFKEMQEGARIAEHKKEWETFCNDFDPSKMSCSNL